MIIAIAVAHLYLLVSEKLELDTFPIEFMPRINDLYQELKTQIAIFFASQTFLFSRSDHKEHNSRDHLIQRINPQIQKRKSLLWSDCTLSNLIY